MCLAPFFRRSSCMKVHTPECLQDTSLRLSDVHRRIWSYSVLMGFNASFFPRLLLMPYFWPQTGLYVLYIYLSQGFQGNWDLRHNPSPLVSQCTLVKRTLDLIVFHKILMVTVTFFYKAHFLTLSQSGGTAALSFIEPPALGWGIKSTPSHREHKPTFHL